MRIWSVEVVGFSGVHGAFHHLDLHVAPQDLLPQHAQPQIGQTLPRSGGRQRLNVAMPPLTAPDVAAESMSDRITLAQCLRRRWS
jgi:hypothetical protein